MEAHNGTPDRRGVPAPSTAETQDLKRLGRDLLTILERERAIVRNLEQGTRRVREAIARRDLPELWNAISANESHVARQVELERDRAACVQGLAAALGEEPNSLTLVQAAERLPQDIRRPILAAREHLGELVEQLATATDDTGSLARGALRMVNDTLTFLADLAARDGGYRPDGRNHQAATSSRMLDCRA